MTHLGFVSQYFLIQVFYTVLQALVLQALTLYILTSTHTGLWYDWLIILVRLWFMATAIALIWPILWVAYFQLMPLFPLQNYPRIQLLYAPSPQKPQDCIIDLKLFSSSSALMWSHASITLKQILGRTVAPVKQCCWLKTRSTDFSVPLSEMRKSTSTVLHILYCMPLCVWS